MLAWSDDYLTGIELIDEQHKTWIDIVNRLEALLKNPFVDDKYDRIVAVLNELTDYTDMHFATEEQLMERIGYRRILSHKVVHNDFVAKIRDVDLAKVDSDQNAYLLDLTNYILTWISSHILKTDKRILAESASGASQGSNSIT